MASTEASRRASIASSSETSFADLNNATKILPKKEKSDKPTGGIKLKKSIAKKTKAKDTESNGTKTADATRSPSPNSPAINGAAARSEGTTDETVNCKHCKKPMSAAVLVSHSPVCLEAKKAKAKKKKEAKEARLKEAKAKEAAEEKEKEGLAASGEGENAGITDSGQPTEPSNKDKSPGAPKPTTATKNPPKKSAGKASTVAADGPKKSKKRKADDPENATKEPKKKKLKKDEPPKPKIPKPKGPVNVELQCGVLLPNGAGCARSLTCKSHSMGAKRSVPGRSGPYDKLLAIYQQKNQAKQQKAMMAAAAGPVEGEGEGGVVDSEEEKELVMGAVARAVPVALEQAVFVRGKRRARGFRVREVVGGLFGGARAFGGAGGVGVDGGDGIGGEGEGGGSRRASMVQQGKGPVPVRKASVASARVG